MTTTASTHADMIVNRLATLATTARASFLAGLKQAELRDVAARLGLPSRKDKSTTQRLIFDHLEQPVTDQDGAPVTMETTDGGRATVTEADEIAAHAEGAERPFLEPPVYPVEDSIAYREAEIAAVDGPQEAELPAGFTLAPAEEVIEETEPPQGPGAKGPTTAKAAPKGKAPAKGKAPKAPRKGSEPKATPAGDRTPGPTTRAKAAEKAQEWDVAIAAWTEARDKAEAESARNVYQRRIDGCAARRDGKGRAKAEPMTLEQREVALRDARAAYSRWLTRADAGDLEVDPAVNGEAMLHAAEWTLVAARQAYDQALKAAGKPVLARTVEA